MNILILGGTRFVGRVLAERLINKQHEVTLFNRGISNADIFSDVETIIGDRNTDIQKLRNRSFDAVIDTCAYLPGQINCSASLLKNKVGKYVFISSISVFAEPNKPATVEDSPKIQLQYAQDKLDSLTINDINGENYGGLKYLCEQKLLEFYPDSHLIIRPGMIIGPHDSTERFARWLKPFINNQDLLVPEPRNLPIQFIDVYDLADFIISLLENGKTGDYNVIGPQSETTFDDVFNTICRVIQSSSRVFWVNSEFLEKNGLAADFYSNFPFFVEDKFRDQYTFNNEKSLNDGLKLSSVEEIIRRTVQWHINTNDLKIKSGLEPEKEKALINSIQYS
jgi:2'-hydroxyisoflavone reductase